MAAKQLLFDEAAWQAILRGVSKLSRAVTATLGPKGRNGLLDKKYGSPSVTKDGITVAKEIELEDPYENIGAQMVREVANKTSDAAGDGTTTATVFAEAIYRGGLKFIAAGANPIGIQRGIGKAVEAAVAHLDKIAKKVKDRDEIKQVATVSANWDTTIGEIIADAMDTVKPANEDERIGVEIVKGAVEFPTGELANNAGLEGCIVVEEVKKRKGNEGFDVAAGEYTDLVKAGIVDPKKVTRTALQNAASIAGLLLTTECLVTEMPEKKTKTAGGTGPDGMGDMGFY